MFAIFTYIFGLDKVWVGVLHFLGVFCILGIGADDAFVLVDIVGDDEPLKFPVKLLVLVHIAEQFEVDRHVRRREETADAVLHPAPERQRARISHVESGDSRACKSTRRQGVVAPRTIRV